MRGGWVWLHVGYQMDSKFLAHALRKRLSRFLFVNTRPLNLLVCEPHVFTVILILKYFRFVFGCRHLMWSATFRRHIASLLQAMCPTCYAFPCKSQQNIAIDKVTRNKPTSSTEEDSQDVVEASPSTSSHDNLRRTITLQCYCLFYKYR